LSVLQIDVQIDIKTAKAFTLFVNIQSQFWLLSNFLQEVTQITMQWHWW